MSKYKVTVGEKFEIEAFELQSVEEVCKLSKIESVQAHQRMRGRLTTLIIYGIFFALITATLIGLHDGSFDEVGYVWGAAAMPLGYILKTFFVESQPP